MSTFIKKYLTISVLRLAIKAGEVLSLPAAGIFRHPFELNFAHPPISICRCICASAHQYFRFPRYFAQIAPHGITVIFNQFKWLF